MELSDYQLLAAVRVARVIDSPGNAAEDAHISYRLVPSQGEHRAMDMLAAEALLDRAGLLLVSPDGRIRSSSQLQVLGALPDSAAIDCLRRILSQKSDSDQRVETGILGELEVVRLCQQDLDAIGQYQLSKQVQQISVLDDSLGYDVLAPAVNRRVRHLEVKTSRLQPSSLFEFFLSRNEFDIGRQDPEWALVACYRIQDSISVVGWCKAQSLHPYLPQDANGRWTEARLRVPTSAFFSGIPPPV